MKRILFGLFVLSLAIGISVSTFAQSGSVTINEATSPIEFTEIPDLGLTFGYASFAHEVAGITVFLLLSNDGVVVSYSLAAFTWEDTTEFGFTCDSSIEPPTTGPSDTVEADISGYVTDFDLGSGVTIEPTGEFLQVAEVNGGSLGLGSSLPAGSGFNPYGPFFGSTAPEAPNETLKIEVGFTLEQQDGLVVAASLTGTAGIVD
jgi:hypothetical protein